jgi:hypothetical protein
MLALDEEHFRVCLGVFWPWVTYLTGSHGRLGGRYSKLAFYVLCAEGEEAHVPQDVKANGDRMEDVYLVCGQALQHSWYIFQTQKRRWKKIKKNEGFHGRHGYNFIIF